jgi:L-aspartate oxidase
MKSVDVLVLGSGIAGLSYALKVAGFFPEKKILVVTKSDESESNTKYAQGGIATVVDAISDSYNKHIADTLKAGDGLCNPEIVEMVIREGPKRLNELINLGIDFDRSTTGRYDLGLEGGHSENRILHHKDITGLEIEKKLISHIHKQNNIEVLTSHFAVDLITQHHLDKMSFSELQCFGAYIFDQKTERVETLEAQVTVLATGGIGQVYRNTTNPLIATGDGIAMAYRAKARVSNMEFVQFHPTALAHRFDHARAFLISEAVRGLGAILRNGNGKKFMSEYDPRGELASRDIVSRAIDSELKKSGDDHVYLDCTSIKAEHFISHFPNIYEKCKEIEIDPAIDWIPVTPAAHYLCGGIDTNGFAQTSIKSLLACGECANTGLHGANRLASNSLLEAIVFAHRGFEKTKEVLASPVNHVTIPDWNEDGTTTPKELILITHNRKEVQRLMSDLVGIIRSNERLQRAANRLNIIFEETEALYKRSTLSPQLFELRNMISTAHLIVAQSKQRKQNRGGFFNVDLM